MKPIPLDLLTLYAGLLQSLGHSLGRGATVAKKTTHGQQRLYAVERVGGAYKQKYIGRAGDPKAEADAARLKRIASEAKVRKTTVSTLKRARIAAPDGYMGRLLEVIAEAGLFDNGAVLVGTAAYQIYPCVVGTHLTAGLMTQDADIAVPAGAALSGAVRGQATLEAILQRADPTFEARMNQTEKWPAVFVAESGFQVDVLTTLRRKPEPAAIRSLAAAAMPLRFMDYLIEEAVEAAALYGSGVLVKVPAPSRYAVHKLIVASQRPAHSKKAPKDLMQARELFSALDNTSELSGAIEEARSRGPKWRSAVEAGLARIGRGAEGALLVPKS